MKKNCQTGHLYSIKKGSKNDLQTGDQNSWRYYCPCLIMIIMRLFYLRLDEIETPRILTSATETNYKIELN
jgi:hypothetical protein